MGDNMAKASAATNKVSAFSAASMFDELALGPPRILTGAVKRSNDAKKICFSKAMDCTDWIEISEEMVERYEYVGDTKCGDHNHPVVKLYLKPPSTDAEKAFLMAERPVPPAVSNFSDVQASFVTALSPVSPLGGWYPSKGNCVRNSDGRLVDPVTGQLCA
ncbi:MULTISPECIES: hypothetical protein [Methylobacterium]|nr:MULTISPECIES: hypothetical protein [Methylobacterium]